MPFHNNVMGAYLRVTDLIFRFPISRPLLLFLPPPFSCVLPSVSLPAFAPLASSLPSAFCASFSPIGGFVVTVPVYLSGLFHGTPLKTDHAS